MNQDGVDRGPVVGGISRQDAFADGQFIVVPPRAAAAAGIAVPTAITAGAHRAFVAGAGEDDRLQQVLDAVAASIRRGPADEVCFVVEAEDLPEGRTTAGADRLLAITEPGDTGEDVLTLMLPDEM
ncbi:DUF6573 family protein [Streptomyces rubiginosohelvolus]|uniref:DUF6573 family protein n=1 Tax=Streptomyces rubiginosohelvolus TaxID=67362 RepID=UPI0033A01078